MEVEREAQAPYYQGGSNIHANNIVELTNPESSILTLEAALAGKRKINEKFVNYGDPLLNEEGINSVISQLRSLVNQISILSFLDDDDIKMQMMLYSRSLIQDLMINKNKYGITKPSDRTKIVTMCQSVTYNTLKRAYKGNDKNFWSRIVMEFSSNTNSSGSDKGLLSKYNMFKK